MMIQCGCPCSQSALASAMVRFTSSCKLTLKYLHIKSCHVQTNIFVLFCSFLTILLHSSPYHFLRCMKSVRGFRPLPVAQRGSHILSFIEFLISYSSILGQRYSNSPLCPLRFQTQSSLPQSPLPTQRKARSCHRQWRRENMNRGFMN